MIDNHRVAVAAHPVGMNHHATVRRPDRVAVIGPDVNPGMQPLRAKDRMHPPTEWRGDLTFRRPGHRAGAAADVLFAGLNPFDHLLDLARGLDQFAVSPLRRLPLIGRSIQHAAPFLATFGHLLAFGRRQFAQLDDFRPVRLQLFLGLAQGFPVGFGALDQGIVIGKDFFQDIHPADKVIEIFGAEQYIEIVDLTVFINIANPTVQGLGLNLQFFGQPIGKLYISLDMLFGVLQLVIDGFVLIFRRVKFLLDRPQLLGDRLFLAPGQLGLALLRFDLLLHTV